MPENSGQTETSAYENLKKRFAEIDHLGGIAGILSKDAQMYMKPGSADDRDGQMTTLAGLMHRLITAPEVGQWLNQAEAGKDKLLPDDRRNLFLMRHDWVESNAQTAEMAEELARLDTEGERLHRKY